MGSARSRHAGRRLRTLWLALAVAGPACQADVVASPLSSVFTSQPSVAPSNEAVAASPSATVRASCWPAPLPSPTGLTSGTFADVVTDNLVQRTAPRVADDSEIIGELNAPVRVYVVEGPVHADGYEWFLVEPEGTGPDDHWWVAAAGKDGEEWLRPVPPEAGRWSVITTEGPSNVVRAAVGPDGRIYVFGGATIEDAPLAASWAFDPRSCASSALTRMPTPRNNPMVAAGADGRLYVIGGYAESETLSAVEVFDPIADSWVSAAPLAEPARFNSAALGAPDGTIWVFGGSPVDLAGAAAYDSVADAWHEETPSGLPQTAFADAYVASDGMVTLLAVGAGGLWRFDPSASTITQIASPRVGAHGASVVALPDGRILKAGGHTSGGCVTVREPAISEVAHRFALLDAYDPSSGTWEALAPLAIDVGAVGAVTVDDVLYLIGVVRHSSGDPGSDRGIDGREVVIARYEPPAERASGGRTAESAGQGCSG